MTTVLQLDTVSFQRQGREILKDISWTIHKGEHWALVGHNGSGKTTLLNMITGYHWPSAGSVEVLGQQFGRVDLRELRKHIGWVSSSLSESILNHHGSDTVLEIVGGGIDATLGLRLSRETQERAEDAMDQFELTGFSTKPFRTLSQGEKQRVLIARAWVSQKPLLILDEPCSGLDLKTRERLLDTVEELAQMPSGPSLIYVTHYVEEIRPSFSHALVLKEGSVVASGSKVPVLTAENLSMAFAIPLEITWHNDRPWARIV